MGLEFNKNNGTDSVVGIQSPSPQPISTLIEEKKNSIGETKTF